MEEHVGRKKIAVVGAGVAGIVAAYVLGRRHDVTLLEKNQYLGGHTNTITIRDGNDAGLCVDTGFIVCNARNYPNFYKFLDQLGIQRQNSDMSFSFYCDATAFGYSGPTIRDFLRYPANLLSPSFLRMLWEQRKFNRQALQELAKDSAPERSLGEYLATEGFSHFFTETYIAPLAAAIWSSPDQAALEIPLSTFLTFFKNHGMLELNTIPQWQVVKGGSHSYVKAFQREFKGKVLLDCAIKGIQRRERSALIRMKSGEVQEYDAVVIATHADEALALLEDPSEQEQALLGAWKYQSNSIVLHTDSSVLPPKRALWSAWNYRRDKEATANSAVTVSYYMNRLQSLESHSDYIVTLNRDSAIDPAKIIYRTTYTHPQYNARSVITQERLRSLSGARATYFCGSYLGYGFHEDAVSSALSVTKQFGMEL
ncbi:MAG: FAD-dependent oxidoreductase [Deltaproteobacteria bacterium]|nr:FAD-dependent oxidoreductase [Deltaproteobacteria bacterium]